MPQPTQWTQDNTTYQRYVDALRAIDRCPHDLDEGFELDFVTNNLDRCEQYGSATRFSEKQRKVIVRLAEKYLGADYAAEMQGQIRLATVMGRLTHADLLNA